MHQCLVIAATTFSAIIQRKVVKWHEREKNSKVKKRMESKNWDK